MLHFDNLIVGNGQQTALQDFENLSLRSVLLPAENSLRIT